MVAAEPCPECGVRDALGRHAGNCPRALEIGLPRLAEDEDPIDPTLDAEEAEYAQREYERAVAQRRSLPPTGPVAQSAELWIAHTKASESSFDALIFDSELAALRYAVAHSMEVKPLQLGVSMIEQTSVDAD